MSFVSRFVTTALALGGLSVAGNSYAHQVQCGYGQYVLMLQNHYSYGGVYDVSCTNGYQRDFAPNVYVGAHSLVHVSGNFGGSVTCTVTGVSTTVHSGFCS